MTHNKNARRQVDVAPAESAGFRLAKTETDRDLVEGRQPVACDGGQDEASLGRREWRWLESGSAWPLDELGNIAGDEIPTFCLSESQPERRRHSLVRHRNGASRGALTPGSRG